MVQTVREFVTDAYSLIDPSSPTVPLQGDELKKGIQFMNELFQYWSANGLMLTIEKIVQVVLTAGVQSVTFGQVGSGADSEEGRIANVLSAWLVKDNVTYPLITLDESDFDAAYKYDPLQGLPRFLITRFETTVTRLRLYPATSEGYTLFVRGKFQPEVLTSNDTMAGLPLYFIRFLRRAVAKDYAYYLGRSEAWTDKLEADLIKAENEMIAVTPLDLKLNQDRESLLNGAYRIRAGV